MREEFIFIFLLTWCPCYPIHKGAWEAYDDEGTKPINRRLSMWNQGFTPTIHCFYHSSPPHGIRNLCCVTFTISSTRLFVVYKNCNMKWQIYPMIFYIITTMAIYLEWILNGSDSKLQISISCSIALIWTMNQVFNNHLWLLAHPSIHAQESKHKTWPSPRVCPVHRHHLTKDQTHRTHTRVVITHTHSLTLSQSASLRAGC